MRVDVSYKRMESSKYLDEIIDKDVAKIKKRMHILKSDEPVHLSMHLEKNPHREEYLSWATLYMPRRVLKVQQKGADAAVAINKVSQALLRQINKYKTKFERHLQKRAKSAG